MQRLRRKTSKYRGVYWNTTQKGWIAQYKTGGKNYYLGCFNTEMEAAKVRNLGVAASNILRPEVKYRFYNSLGKPTVEEVNTYILANDNLSYVGKSNKYSSRYRGVTYNREKNAWRVSLQYQGRVHFMGYFDNENDAARAYNKAALEIKGPWVMLNTIDPYLEDHSLRAMRLETIYEASEEEEEESYELDSQQDFENEFDRWVTEMVNNDEKMDLIDNLDEISHTIFEDSDGWSEDDGPALHRLSFRRV